MKFMPSTSSRRFASFVLAIATACSVAGCDDGGRPVSTATPIATSTPSPSPVPMPIASAPVEGLRVHADQVGYLADKPKRIIVAADEAFGGLDARIVDKNDNDKPVWEGKLPVAVFDAESGDWVAQADFGALTSNGRYEADVGGTRSDPFFVGDSLYNDVWVRVARSYTLQRSNFAQEDPQSGLKLLAGHKQDGEAKLYFEDKGQPSAIDASGGWYDAGDYGKYVPTAAITAGQLLLAYELNPERAGAKFLTDREKAFWKPAAPAPDVLTEVKYELDWMLRMQRADGAVYHKVSGLSFPGFILPAEDIQDRYVFGLSSFGTAMFAAVAAMGARVYEPFDPAYAAELLNRAKRAQAWLDAHPDAYFRQDDGQDAGSGAYAKTTDREERFWALAELFKTTGDAAYDRKMSRDYADLIGKPPGIVGWGNAQLLGLWAAATTDKTPSTGREAAGNAIVAAADEIAGRIETDGYRLSLAEGDYAWGSNKNALAYGELLLLADALSPKEAYESGALDQLHAVLGRNAMGMSYVTGFGSRYPRKLHHRISLMSGVKVPGLLAGGPNKFGDDAALKRVVEAGAAPAKSYVDDAESYASNEYAIDYDAPLFVVLTAFYEPDARIE